MQIERLRLVNFRQHEDTELVLGAGLTGIIGPNGAGKTTLLEAIAWALYGSEAARGTRDTIRRRGAGARVPVRVELDFSLGVHRYSIVRSLNQAELYQDGDPAPIANSLVSVTEKVARLLGMTREEFFNTYFTGQKQLAVMGAMTGVARAQFLSRVLGYDRLRRAQERLREGRQEVAARLKALQQLLPDPAELDREAEAVLERLVLAGEGVTRASGIEATALARRQVVLPRWQALQQLRERVGALQSDLRLAEHKVSNARESFQLLDRQLVLANEARTKLETLAPQLEPLEALRRDLALLDEQMTAYIRRQGLLAELEHARTGVQTVRAQAGRLPPADAVEGARSRVEQLEQELDALDEQARERRSVWDRDLQEAMTKRDTLRDQYRDLKEQVERIQQAGAAGACPTCARPLGGEFPTVLGMLDRQLEEVRFNGNYYKSRIEQLATEPPELGELARRRSELERGLNLVRAELARFQTQLQEAPRLREEQTRLEGQVAMLEQQVGSVAPQYDPVRHTEVKRRIAELEPLDRQAERLRERAGMAEALVPQAESAERGLSEMEAEWRRLQQQLAGLGYSDEAWAAARAEWEEADRACQQAAVGVVRARGELSAAEEADRTMARRREERARREAEAREAARDLALHNELDRAFTDLRTDLNQQLRPDLSDLSSAFLRDLTNGRYTELELDESYEAIIMEGGEPKPVISGGEEDVAHLALRLAISQMIADRAGQPLSLLVLDEVFGSLDEERRAAVVDLLRSLADRFPQVILITHIETVREGFDRVIRVEFDQQRGAARVRDEQPGAGDGLAA